MLRCALPVLVLLALLVNGCVVIQDFDPVGNAVSLRASWTIDGEAPTPTNCALLGADRVHVVFLDGRRPVSHSALFFECRAGSFDTDDNEVIAAGTWYARLEAIDSGGALVAYGPTQTLTVSADGGPPGDGGVIPQRTEIIMEVDFDSALANAHFELDGATPTFETCAARGIHEVGLTVDGVEATSSRAPCVRGVVGQRMSPAASHQIALTTYDEDGGVLASTAPETFEVLAGDLCELGGRCHRRCTVGCESGEQCSSDRCFLPDETSPRIELP